MLDAVRLNAASAAPSQAVAPDVAELPHQAVAPDAAELPPEEALQRRKSWTKTTTTWHTNAAGTAIPTTITTEVPISSSEESTYGRAAAADDAAGRFLPWRAAVAVAAILPAISVAAEVIEIFGEILIF